MPVCCSRQKKVTRGGAKFYRILLKGSIFSGQSSGRLAKWAMSSWQGCSLPTINLIYDNGLVSVLG